MFALNQTALSVSVFHRAHCAVLRGRSVRLFGSELGAHGTYAHLDLIRRNPQRLHGGCHALKVKSTLIGREMKGGAALKISIQ